MSANEAMQASPSTTVTALPMISSYPRSHSGCSMVRVTVHPSRLLCLCPATGNPSHQTAATNHRPQRSQPAVTCRLDPSQPIKPAWRQILVSPMQAFRRDTIRVRVLQSLEPSSLGWVSSPGILLSARFRRVSVQGLGHGIIWTRLAHSAAVESGRVHPRLGVHPALSLRQHSLLTRTRVCLGPENPSRTGPQRSSVLLPASTHPSAPSRRPSFRFAFLSHALEGYPILWTCRAGTSAASSARMCPY
jgi:hypothetical protein